MASQFSQQYAFRAQKSLGLVGGTPDYVPLSGFVSPDVPARTYHYSNDGRLFAYALPNVVRIFQAEGATLLQELTISNIIELQFSPRGTYLSTWERPVKLEDGAQHKNLRIFSVSTGEELIAFTQKSQEGWNLQYTISESHAVRLVSQEVQVFRPAEWDKGVVDKLRVEGASMVSLSPGLNPSVAVFVGEKKGAPASVKIYGLLALSGVPTCSKTFYKADRAQIKWNDLGTQALIVTQTEVDNSNMSYYGETSMYLLSVAGNFDCRVALDKEGPIHDVAWSPNSKEFGVVYGYMPAKTMLFDQRVRTLHDFGSAPHNTISFNPQGRLLFLAGFGNLAGKIDVFDRRTLNKVCTIDAPNTSYCSWSPDGRFMLTATLSPRLRVDNGIKIWHANGPLVHVQAVEELYQVSWRPTPVDQAPPFGQGIPPAPQPSPSVLAAALTSKAMAAKPAGAYRPPGARGVATPAIFKREDEGGAPRVPTGSGTVSGSATPPRGYNRGPSIPGGMPTNGVSRNGQAGRRHVPGAAPRTPPPAGDQGQGQDKKRKKKEKKKGDKGEGSGTVTPNGVGSARPSLDVQTSSIDVTVNDVKVEPPEEPVTSVPPTPGAEQLDPTAKKVRNLNKKLKAIEELKEKAKRGERLEATQLKKMEGEADIRKELASASLGVAG
ncbi:eukaryotic translation initiation factor eIF2A-domain-containing protein [Boletus edulis]|uniref:Eukaryotic translation initiation factor 2A n=1 Tax=Boletus edulis BED1 TaxID=1328754 RepID=A0AAD4BRU8_BOLED|nr:eukaryotic translation initiation factor eIF2A-domain-containing protein [Boletus edulis]KAF8437688.1 eukaryotic translation initiation factor eIF2A-domain-containing protein [Boletus edulis BED1]